MSENSLWERAAHFENALKAQWLDPSATPFPGQLTPSDPEAARAVVRGAVRTKDARKRLFNEAPTLAVWATLDPLAANYGAHSKDVYEHIESGFGIARQSSPQRDALKSDFRQACRQLGLKVSGNSPSDLFFQLLGVADAQLNVLAEALVIALDRLGPPATEDTPSAVAWQNRMTDWMPDNKPRPRSAVRFDRIGTLCGTRQRLETRGDSNRSA